MTPESQETISEPAAEQEPGVLDGVENRIILTFSPDGNTSFAIGKGVSPFNIINAAFLLERIANQMLTAAEAQQQAEIQRTAAVMRSIKSGRIKEPDPWRG